MGVGIENYWLCTWPLHWCCVCVVPSSSFIPEKTCSHIIWEYAYWNVIPVIRSLHFSFAALIASTVSTNDVRNAVLWLTPEMLIPSWRGSIGCCVGSPNIVLLYTFDLSTNFFLPPNTFWNCCFHFLGCCCCNGKISNTSLFLKNKK
jgi:hypothetical protein